MIEIRNKVITKLKTASSEEAQEMLMEASIVITVIGLKAKDELRTGD